MPKKNIKKAIRVAVWNTYGGKDLRYMKCYANCGRDIDAFDFECGHVIAESLGGPTTLQNLRPICGLCNKSMGNQNMNDFRVSMGYMTEEDALNDRLNRITECVYDETGRNNTAYPDGSKAGVDSQVLDVLGIKGDIIFCGTGVDPEEKLNDCITLMKLLHKWKICHRDDFFINDDSPEALAVESITSDDLEYIGDDEDNFDDYEWEDLCIYVKRNGETCGNVAKENGFCARHCKK